MTSLATAPDLSVVPPTLTAMNPWATLTERPDITLYFADLPSRLRGFCDHDTMSIWISKTLRQRERNKVLTHELLHLERGPVFSCWEAIEERAVEEATARALILIGPLCDALRWSRDPHDIAFDLHVPAYLVKVRWESMRHPAERAAIAAVMADLAELGAA